MRRERSARPVGGLRRAARAAVVEGWRPSREAKRVDGGAISARWVAQAQGRGGGGLWKALVKAPEQGPFGSGRQGPWASCPARPPYTAACTSNRHTPTQGPSPQRTCLAACWPCAAAQPQARAPAAPPAVRVPLPGPPAAPLPASPSALQHTQHGRTSVSSAQRWQAARAAGTGRRRGSRAAAAEAAARALGQGEDLRGSPGRHCGMPGCPWSTGYCKGAGLWACGGVLRFLRAAPALPASHPTAGPD
jgi:hypothetical protein